MKKLPSYLTVSTVYGTLSGGCTGQGLSGALLADALDRAGRAEIAAFALVVDAKDASAVSFFQHHGFITLLNSPMTLFLPLATIPQK